MAKRFAIKPANGFWWSAIALAALALSVVGCGSEGASLPGSPGGTNTGGGGTGGNAGIPGVGGIFGGGGIAGTGGISGGGGIAGTAGISGGGGIAGAAGISGGGGVGGTGGISGGGGIAGAAGIAGTAGAAGIAGTGGAGGIAGTGGAGGAGGQNVGGAAGGPPVNPCTGAACDPAASNRVQINLGETPWKFALQNPTGAEAVAFNDSSWQEVGIPHSWNDIDRFVNGPSGDWAGGPDPVGGGPYWYRKHFTIDPKYADRKIFVEFEGAHMGARVFVNGQFIPGNSKVNPQATHVNGFVPFMVDITDRVKKDGTDNVLAVNVGINASWFQMPSFSLVPRFGQGDGGLFRPVWMHITDKIHVPQNVYSVLNNWGTFVTTTAATAQQATVKIQTNVQNESAASADVTLTSQIIDMKGNVVTSVDSAQTIAAGATYMFDQTATVNNPTLWYPNTSTLGKPYMYKVYHLVQVAGKILDVYTSPLGIRTLTWNKDLPIFNGTPMYLWGVATRYDYPALGTAMPEEVTWKDAKIAAEAGTALWRPGHSSSGVELVDACDYYGIMVVQPSGEGEGAFNSTSITDYNGILKSENHRDMIVRDRNHPSILAWEASNGAMATPFAQALMDIAKQYDPINTHVQADRTPNAANGYILGCTLVGCEMLVKSNWPNNPAWGSEYWGRHAARFAYDVEIAFAAEFVNNWRKSRQKPAFGIAQWYLAETPGENGPFLEGKQPAEVRSFGSSMMDAQRIPKLLYYIYKAAWNPFSVRPTIALAHHWNRSGSVRVNAFSNCPKVRLKVNGTQVGADQVPNPWSSSADGDLTQNTTSLPFQVRWDGVAWAAGTLRAECLDDAGTVVTFDERKTAGAPDHIVLTVDPELVKPNGKAFQIQANGSDAALVLATVVDANGIWVPTANNLITWSLSGPGNYRGGTEQYVTAGQPSTYHAPLDPNLNAEGGYCKVAIRSTFTPGTVTVTAKSQGLGDGTTTFTTVAPVPLKAPVSP